MTENDFSTIVHAISSKPALGAVSIVVGVVAHGVYILKIAKDEIKPHPLSWFLWGFVTAVAALAQRAKGGGPGSWVTALTAIACILIGLLSLSKVDRWFSSIDWGSLALGVLATFFFAFANNPNAAAMFATAADVLGYTPTIKNGWNQPYSDSELCFWLNSFKFIPALYALDAYSIATWLYPASLVIMNGSVAIVLRVRRNYTNS